MTPSPASRSADSPHRSYTEKWGEPTADRVSRSASMASRARAGDSTAPGKRALARQGYRVICLISPAAARAQGLWLADPDDYALPQYTCTLRPAYPAQRRRKGTGSALRWAAWSAWCSPARHGRRFRQAAAAQRYRPLARLGPCALSHRQLRRRRAIFLRSWSRGGLLPGNFGAVRRPERRRLEQLITRFSVARGKRRKPYGVLCDPGTVALAPSGPDFSTISACGNTGTRSTRRYSSCTGSTF